MVFDIRLYVVKVVYNGFNMDINTSGFYKLADQLTKTDAKSKIKQLDWQERRVVVIALGAFKSGDLTSIKKNLANINSIVIKLESLEKPSETDASPRSGIIISFINGIMNLIFRQSSESIIHKIEMTKKSIERFNSILGNIERAITTKNKELDEKRLTQKNEQDDIEIPRLEQELEKLKQARQGLLTEWSRESKAGPLEGLRKKNLAASKTDKTDKKEVPIVMSEKLLSDKRTDVHMQRVWLTKKVKKRNGADKAKPSSWYVKDANLEIAWSPIYSLLVPGSPEGRLVQKQGVYHEVTDYASKGIEGARRVTAKDLKSGKMTGLARCAVATAVMGYRDIHADNALLDRHNRLVMLDYNMDSAERINLQQLLKSPLNQVQLFFDRAKRPTVEELKAHEEKPEFKQEMARALVHHLSFPADMLTEVLAKRHRANKETDREATESSTSDIEILSTSIGMLREEILGDSEAAKAWRKELSDVLKGDLNELAKSLVSDMADSRILRELDYKEFVNAICENLTRLRQDISQRE